MTAWTKNERLQRGIALVELMFAMVIGIAVLGIFTFASNGIARNLYGTDRYYTGVTTENRIMDYVAADLRRAVRVSILSGSTSPTIKNTGTTSYSITNTTRLVISIPDYYGANAANNSAGSSYKTTRYPRTTLNTSAFYNSNSNSLLNGIVPWDQAQTVVSGKRVTRFAPPLSGSGELQVRYYQAARSASDSTQCFFRAEYPAGATTPSSTVEIAEHVSDALSTTTLVISGRNTGLVFKLQSSFTPAYRKSGETSAPTTGILEVSLRNPRRD
jgi:hypothetical protein